MNEADLREICQWAQKRDEKFYVWVRHLLLLAAGTLSVLVSFQSPQSNPGLPGMFLDLAWIALGSGILLGSICLYGELWIERARVKLLKEQKKNIPLHDIASAPSPIVVKLPWWIRQAESVF